MRIAKKTALCGLGDLELVTMTRSGISAAEEELVKRYFRLVCAKTRRYYLTGWNNEDFIQEGMMGLIRAIRCYDPQKNSSFAAYADLCIRRQLYSVLKKALTQYDSPQYSHVSLNDSTEDGVPSGQLADEGYNPEDSAINRDELDRLFTALQDRLSRLEDEILRAYLAGESIQEIAEATGKSYKTVDNAIQRIRKKALTVAKQSDNR